MPEIRSRVRRHNLSGNIPGETCRFSSASTLYAPRPTLGVPHKGGSPTRKGTTMTNNDNANTGNQTSVHNPKAPGEVEKVNPQTGGTTTESDRSGCSTDAPPSASW